MENYVIKFKFNTPVHFGDLNQGPDNTSSDFLMQNDSIFSALVIEANNLFGQSGVDKIYKMCNESVTFSSMMPYKNENYFIPKPTMFIEATKQSEKENYAKMLKKLKYIPASYLSEYLIKGKTSELPVDELVEKQKSFGEHSVEQKVTITRDENEDNVPFHIGSFTFSKDSGAYILVSCEPEEMNYLKGLLTSLGFVGIGGRRSSGYGKFSFEVIKLSESQNEDLKAYNNLINGTFERYMTLSVCLPKDLTDELLEDAYYMLVRRSGFIDSTTYNSSIMKKKDVFAFSVGSTFTEKFEGQIKNVASEFGKHPVYKNLKPFFIGVE